MNRFRPRVFQLVLCLAASCAVPVHAQEDAAAPAGTTAVDTAYAGTAADSAASQRPAPVMGPALPDTAAAAALLEAAEAARPESTEAVVPVASAPVFLNGSELVRIRVAREGRSPVERANAIRQRLNAIVADPSVDPESLSLRSTPEGVELRAGDAFLLMITPGDAPTSDPNELGIWFAALTEQAQNGIRGEREGRRPLRMLFSAGLAVLFTLIAIALFRLLVYLGRRWHDFLGRYLRERLPAIRIRNFEVLSRAQLSGAVLAVLDRLDVVAGLFLVYAYLTSVFSLFPYTQGWAWMLFHFAATNLFDFLRSIGAAIPGLVVIAIIIMLFRWLAQLSDRFFDAIRDGTIAFAGFHPDLARPSKRLVRILIWIIAIMICYPYIPGAQSRAVQGVSILLGLMVSIGSTSVVGNVLAGLVLTYSRSFSNGDRVQIGEHTGDVVALGFFATKLRTIRNEEITIPNGQVAAGSITNYTRMAHGPGLVLHTEVTIGYDVDWRKVHELLIGAALRVAAIEKEPPPYVFQTALGDYSVAYELNAITRNSHEQREIYSELHAAIQDAFNEAGVEILSPAYTALRDGNAAAMPESPKGPRPTSGAFRMKRADETSG